MSDLRRLHEEGDSFERQLLASARRDRMSPAARGALVATVSAAVVGSAALGTQAATVGKGLKTGVSALAKWIALGAAGTAIVGAVAIPIVRTRHAASYTQPLATTTVAPLESETAAGNDVGDIDEAPSIDEPESKTPSAPHRPRASSGAHPKHRATAPAASSSDGSSLTAELALIEEARTSLGSGHPADAIRALDEHRAKFAHGALAEEAAVLRIESLARMGDGATAASLARSFLAARPRSPYAARVRRVLSAFDGATPQ